MNGFLSRVDAYRQTGLINDKLYQLIQNFYGNYRDTIADLPEPEQNLHRFELLIQLVVDQIQRPHSFSIFHRAIRSPFDFYQFGLDFIRPFIDMKNSKIFGLANLKLIQTQLKKKENVVLLANHQIEPDAQVISLMLEKIDPQLASDMVFIAGHRVVNDPMAIPMSLGRNLLCIYSKKHMNGKPDEKAEKILHNQRTLKQMQELLNEGGHCIYVAPSGGRDRPGVNGEFEVAPFDSQSIELFWLLAQQAKSKTHFYPLALKTYPLMPPPKQVEKELGERRLIHYTPVYLAFGEEVNMVDFPGSENLDKKSKRDKRAEYIWEMVRQSYQDFGF